MKELRSEIGIEASASLVWQILTDFPAFPQWSPFILQAQGTPRIEPRGPDCDRFFQQEVFTGLLVPLLAWGRDTDTRRGFEEMNRALKARAEKTPG
jgi:hypothetical protein